MEEFRVAQSFTLQTTTVNILPMLWQLGEEFVVTPPADLRLGQMEPAVRKVTKIVARVGRLRAASFIDPDRSSTGSFMMIDRHAPEAINHRGFGRAVMEPVGGVGLQA